MKSDFLFIIDQFADDIDEWLILTIIIITYAVLMILLNVTNLFSEY